jgi:hypothetical protein
MLNDCSLLSCHTSHLQGFGSPGESSSNSEVRAACDAREMRDIRDARDITAITVCLTLDCTWVWIRSTSDIRTIDEARRSTCFFCPRLKASFGWLGLSRKDSATASLIFFASAAFTSSCHLLSSSAAAATSRAAFEPPQPILLNATSSPSASRPRWGGDSTLRMYRSRVFSLKSVRCRASRGATHKLCLCVSVTVTAIKKMPNKRSRDDDGPADGNYSKLTRIRMGNNRVRTGFLIVGLINPLGFLSLQRRAATRATAAPRPERINQEGLRLCGLEGRRSMQ